jgi:LysR family carnitine catabolism transcriptional activator
MRINLDLRQLEVFIAIAHHSNFRLAAAQLHVSQPALSRTLGLTEAALGTRLFDRNTRSVHLTPAGSELLPIARRIVAEFHDSMSELSHFIAGRRGRVRMAILPSMARRVAQAIAAFGSTNPDIEFQVQSDNAKLVLAAVENGDADIGITVQPPPDGRFTFQHLIDDEFVLICRADDPLAQQVPPDQPVSWSVLEKHRFIATPVDSSVRAATDEVFMRLGLIVRPTHHAAGSLTVCGELVAAGLGVCVLPRSGSSLLDQATLVSRRLVSPHVDRRLGIVSQAGRTLSPATALFNEHLRVSFSSLQAAPL